MRLTKQVKDAIYNAALEKSGLPLRKAQIRQKYADFAEACRVSVVDDSQIEKFEDLKRQIMNLKLPIDAPDLKVDTDAYLNVAGQRRRIWWCGAQGRDEAKLYSYRACPREIVIKADSELASALSELDKEADLLNEEVETLKANIYAVLDSVTTDKKLYEIWPEAKAFVPSAERAAVSNLPAVLIGELNKVIGLP